MHDNYMEDNFDYLSPDAKRKRNDSDSESDDSPAASPIKPEHVYRKLFLEPNTTDPMTGDGVNPRMKLRRVYTMI